MQLFYVDTFININKALLGNPAAVLVLDQQLTDEKLQSIAIDLNIPATAFLTRNGNIFNIRWFTPYYQLDICGHASMAAAHVIFNLIAPDLTTIQFHGRNIVKAKREAQLIYLDFPKKDIEACADSDLLTQGLGIQPIAIYRHKDERCLVVFKTENEVKALKPDMDVLKLLPYRGIDVTARSEKVDFVCRTFYPKKTANTEDAVCGAAHCMLVPYWAEQLNKNKLHSYQTSDRGGELFCVSAGDRVFIGGESAVYKQCDFLLENK
jgi:PhzF family phenazine biosynthesis protein